MARAGFLFSEKLPPCLVFFYLLPIKARLSRLYDALETGKLGLDDLAPRIKELKRRQDELSKTRVQIEADMVVQGVKQVDAAMVKAYAQDLRSLLEEPGFTQRKAFLCHYHKMTRKEQR